MPLSAQVHVNRPLSNISIAYQVQGLIADQVAKAVPVKHESDSYFVYTKDNFRLDETRRANGAESNKALWNLSTATYSLQFHALHDVISDRDRDNADEALRLDVDAVEMLTGKILLRKEQVFSDLIGTAANWGSRSSMTSTFAWNVQTTLSNPIPFMDSAASAILYASGQRANVGVLDDRTFKAAKEHGSIVDRVKYTSPDSVTKELLARLFNLDNLYVSSAVRNTADEGQADSMSLLLTDCAWVGYVEMNPGLKKASALYQFVKSSEGLTARVKKWRKEELESDVVEVQTNFDIKAVASDCAFHINDTVQ